MRTWLVKIATYRYECLLAALLLHLFVGIVMRDMDFYTRVVWPLNMIVVGVASIGVFVAQWAYAKTIRAGLFVLVLAPPLSLPWLGDVPGFMQALSLLYAVYFAFILWEVLRFLLRPGYIDTDIIVAAACGYLLLLEVTVFAMQMLYYGDPTAFAGVSDRDPASTYIDLTYFATVLQTTVGFGDITPRSHHARLLTGLFGITGQFYTVLLVGVLISKFSAREQP